MIKLTKNLLVLLVLLLTVLSFAAISQQKLNDFGNSFIQESSIQPASIFQSNMVIQQQMPIRIWGTANEGATIKVLFSGKNRETKANSKNEWMVVFPPMKSSKEPISLTINNKFHFENILLGEVWLCTGQSNMVYNMKRLNNSKDILAGDFAKDIRLINYDGIRIVAKEGFTPEELERCNLKDYFKGNWVENNQETAANFSAIGWYFGKFVNQSLDVPVGLISVAVGGSAINNWIPTSILKSNPLTANWFEKDWLTNQDFKIAHRDRAKEAFQHVIKPEEPFLIGKMPYRWICEPGFIFDAGLAPLQNLSFRGALWYQGESDAEKMTYADRYKELFPLMVKSWRGYFNNGKFPVLTVQLPGFNSEAWPYFREIQRELNDYAPNTQMAVTIDLGMENDVHPPEKEPIGKRLSNLALKHVYGKKIEADFPEVKSIKKTKEFITINFKNTAKGFRKIEKEISGFEISDEKGIFYPVKAKLIDANRIKLTNRVTDPTGVRYAWTPYPKPSVQLFNSEGLPLGPFVKLLK